MRYRYQADCASEGARHVEKETKIVQQAGRIEHTTQLKQCQLRRWIRWHQLPIVLRHKPACFYSNRVGEIAAFVAYFHNFHFEFRCVVNTENFLRQRNTPLRKTRYLGHSCNHCLDG